MSTGEIPKAYDSPLARLRAIFRIPAPEKCSAILEIRVAPLDRPWLTDLDWGADRLVHCVFGKNQADHSATHPAIQTCTISNGNPLSFTPQSFDVVVLPCTLDDLLAQGLPQAKAEQYLIDIYQALKPGGLLIGCCANKSSPLHWSRYFKLLMGTHNAKNKLAHHRFEKIKIFNLLTSLDEPRSIVSCDNTTSKLAYFKELQSAAAGTNYAGYLSRRIIVALSLNRYLEPLLFYWANKPC